MVYIILLLISLFFFGPLIFILLSFLIFKRRLGLVLNFSQIYSTVQSMMQKMQKGEYNFHDFQQRTNEKTDLSMSKKEALEILGLPESATKQEINTAYHKLMQKNHPDKGGSHYLAKQINKARDILLK